MFSIDKKKPVLETKKISCQCRMVVREQRALARDDGVSIGELYGVERCSEERENWRFVEILRTASIDVEGTVTTSYGRCQRWSRRHTSGLRVRHR
jgi:hypothetical protein